MAHMAVVDSETWRRMADGMIHFQDAAACTKALEQELTLRPEQQHCTGPIECKQDYSLTLINCSAGAVTFTNATALRRQHKLAKAACETSRGALPSGGWCLTPRGLGHERECSGRQYDTGCVVRVGASSRGVNSSYFLPRMHFVPDGRVLALVDRLLQPDPAWPWPSLADIGAGVGQFCSSLLGIDSRRDCRSYDGAGNVQSVTNNLVKWVDLTTALSVPRSQWVLSVEVGEHMYATQTRRVAAGLNTTHGVAASVAWPSTPAPLPMHASRAAPFRNHEPTRHTHDTHTPAPE